MSMTPEELERREADFEALYDSDARLGYGPSTLPPLPRMPEHLLRRMEDAAIASGKMRPHSRPRPWSSSTEAQAEQPAEDDDEQDDHGDERAEG